MLPKRKRSYLIGSFVMAIAVLSISCAPAVSPTATPPRPTPTSVVVPSPSVSAAPVPTATRVVAVAPSPTPVPVAAPTQVPTSIPIVRAGDRQPGLQYPWRVSKDWKDSDIKKGGILVANMNADIAHFDSRESTSYTVLVAISPVYNKLLRTKGGSDANPFALEVTPDFAEKWDISADGKVYTFYLRKGVKWQNLPPVNGREMTAQDVVYSLNSFKTKAPPIQQDLQVIDKIEAVDNYTVRLTLREASAPFLAILMQPSLVIFPKEVEDRDGNFKSTAIGAGPMIMQRYNAGASIIYRKNPDYFELGKPYLDGYKVLIIKDQDTRNAAFRTSQIDLDVLGMQGRSPKEIEDFKSRFPDLSIIQYYFSLPQSGGLAFDTRKAPFNDIRVRRALSLAVDKESMAKTIAPDWPVSWSLMLPWFYVFDSPPTLKDLGPWYQYDSAKAKALLTEAGYPNGFDGGQILHSAGFGQAGADIAAWRLEDWKKIGVTFKLQVVDHVSFRGRFDKGDYTVATAGIVIRHQDFDSMASLIYSKGPNWFNVFDPVIDGLIEQERLELDPAKRKVIFRQIWDRELDQMFRFTTYLAPSNAMWRGYVRNFGAAYPMYNGGTGFLGRQLSDVWMDERAPKRSLE